MTGATRAADQVFERRFCLGEGTRVSDRAERCNGEAIPSSVAAESVGLEGRRRVLVDDQYDKAGEVL